jgi:hypothetical protein
VSRQFDHYRGGVALDQGPRPGDNCLDAFGTLVGAERVLPPRIMVPRNVSFSGSGFLMSYHMGVLNVLQQRGVLVRGESHVAGASGGALVASAWVCGLTVDVILQVRAERAWFDPRR